MNLWRDSKSHIDLWSLVHLLSGFCLYGGFHWLGFDFLPTIIYSTLLLILWEAFEYFINILETPVNVASDIIIGIFGSFLAAWLYFVKDLFSVSLYLSIVAITLVLSLFGFLNYVRRSDN